jgi:NitT/TauT family transport system permease protein
MTNRSNNLRSVAVQTGVVGVLIGIWTLVWATGIFHESALPSPLAVLRAFGMELRTWRLTNDLVVSLFRVSCGFSIAVALGIPTGLWLGRVAASREALLPLINFFRNLSPLAWIPFAILWFGVGDAATIFLIFLAVYFPVALATIAAVGSIPAVYFRVARAYGLTGVEGLSKVTLPAIMPQIITTLRVTAGLAWLIDVAAEMVAGRDGLGFAVMDSRNGLRTDLLIVQMIVIGLIGVTMDRVLMRLTRIPSVQWGYQR